MLSNFGVQKKTKNKQQQKKAGSSSVAQQVKYPALSL